LELFRSRPFVGTANSIGSGGISAMGRGDPEVLKAWICDQKRRLGLTKYE